MFDTDSHFQNKQRIVISCSPHHAPYLKTELNDLGFEIENESPAAVTIEGSWDDVYLLNLSLRTGNRVYFMLDEFRAASADDIYDHVKTFPWENMLKDDGYFSVHSEGNHSSLLNTMFLNVKVKDAIADRFRDQTGKRPDSGPDKEFAVVYVHWKYDDACSLYIDTTGEPISKHGYRKIPLNAPLQESLAAAMIMSTQWNKQTPFINPMCGSGTLAIEAAMLAIDKAPGLSRVNFSFMHIKQYDEQVFLNVKKILEERILPTLSAPVISSDNNHKALNAAKANARNAGVDHLIEFQLCEFAETKIPEGNGVVILNPPYGERLGNADELSPLYKSIGDFFKQKCSGYTGYVFTANLDLAKHIGLRANRRIPFLNGKLECKLFGFNLYSGTKKMLKQDETQAENHNPGSVSEV